MANADKILRAMRKNPRDWRIEDLKVLAIRFGIGFRQQGTSHVTFRHPAGGGVVVPAYVRKFVALIDSSAKSA